jgi:hypothetical protein
MGRDEYCQGFLNVGGNALVLVGYALALIILAAIALRRSTVAH